MHLLLIEFAVKDLQNNQNINGLYLHAYKCKVLQGFAYNSLV